MWRGGCGVGNLLASDAVVRSRCGGAAHIIRLPRAAIRATARGCAVPMRRRILLVSDGMGRGMKLTCARTSKNGLKQELAGGRGDAGEDFGRAESPASGLLPFLRSARRFRTPCYGIAPRFRKLRRHGGGYRVRARRQDQNRANASEPMGVLPGDHRAVGGAACVLSRCHWSARHAVRRRWRSCECRGKVRTSP